MSNVTTPVVKHRSTAYSGGFPLVYEKVMIAMIAVGPILTSFVPPKNMYTNAPINPE